MTTDQLKEAIKQEGGALTIDLSARTIYVGWRDGDLRHEVSTSFMNINSLDAPLRKLLAAFRVQRGGKAA